jgi:hypothetical protein
MASTTSTSPSPRLGAVGRLVAYVLVLLATLGAGAALGSAVGPEPDRPPIVTTPDHDAHGG